MTAETALFVEVSLNSLMLNTKGNLSKTNVVLVVNSSESSSELANVVWHSLLYWPEIFLNGHNTKS